MTLMPVADVIDHIVKNVVPMPAENIALDLAQGRVLAADLSSRVTQPPFDASAMDGYALRADDTGHPPVRLRVIGTSAAGQGFAGKVGSGEAVRIFTGAPVPSGGDSIVIQENTKSAGADWVDILEQARVGRHIRPHGYDFRESETLIAAGVRLTARHLLLAAAMNHATLPVRRRPSIAILANGDELKPPGSTLGPGQIVSSIPVALASAVTSWGGEPRSLGIAQDTRESLNKHIEASHEAGILVTIGGASVGDLDLMRGALEAAGAQFDVLKAAIRPGKPIMFGRRGTQRVLSLPGNPISALICATVFLRPLIIKLLGLPVAETPRELPLLAALERNGDRAHYMRARLDGGGVLPLPDQDSSLMKSFAAADCLVIRSPFAPPAPPGTLVPILPLDF